MQQIFRTYCAELFRSYTTGGQVGQEVSTTGGDPGQAAAVFSQEAKDAVHGLFGRMAALEGRIQDQCDTNNNVKELQARCKALAAGAAGQVQEVHERLERTSKAANLMIFGLPEGEAGSEPQLVQEVGSRIYKVAPNFATSAIVSASRGGRCRADQSRPVRMMMQTPKDKHVALRARSSMKRDGIRLDDDLTRHQQRQR